MCHHITISTLRAYLGAKYLNTTIFKCHDITMIYYDIFYINPLWYLVDMYKKLVIAIKTFKLE
jgi:hypothetical protein